jgi:hypothetical protein
MWRPNAASIPRRKLISHHDVTAGPKTEGGPTAIDGLVGLEGTMRV